MPLTPLLLAACPGWRVRRLDGGATFSKLRAQMALDQATFKILDKET